MNKNKSKNRNRQHDKENVLNNQSNQVGTSAQAEENRLVANASNENYEVTGNPDLFNFMYYSFFTIFSEGVNIEPVSNISKFIRMAGVLIGAVINFLILAVYFTVVTEKYRRNIQGLTVWTSSFSVKINDHMKSKFQHDADANRNWLATQGSELSKQIESIQHFFKTGEIKDK